MLKYFNIAAQNAEKVCSEFDNRDYLLGSFGIRSDGSKVYSRNIAIIHNGILKIKNPFFHAEGRLVKKMGKNARSLFVVRIKTVNEFCMAKPCKACEVILKSFGVNEVYYTIDNESYGLWLPKRDKTYYYNF